MTLAPCSFPVFSPFSPFLSSLVLPVGRKNSFGAPQFLDHAGYSVDGDHDLNADGHPDVLVGVWRQDAGPQEFGQVWVESGADGQRIHTLVGPPGINQFGIAVSFVGDVDGDGVADILVGAPLQATVYLYSEVDASLIRVMTGPPFFGHRVADAGDVNGDGTSDVLVSSWNVAANGPQSGRVWVRSGLDDQVLWTWDGQGGDRLGDGLDTAGDVDGDGHADVLLGAPGGGVGQERVEVRSGFDGSLLLDVVGKGPFPQSFGASVAGGSDLTGDNRPDLLIGAPSQNLGRGSLQAYDGQTSAELWSLESSLNTALGSQVAFLRDLDGDGVSEALAGAPVADPSYGGAPKSNAGEVIVLAGATGEELLRLGGLYPHGAFGLAVAAAGDLNKDGAPDIFVGAPSGSVPHPGGATFALSLVPRTLTARSACPGSQNSTGQAATLVGSLGRRHRG